VLLLLINNRLDLLVDVHFLPLSVYDWGHLVVGVFTDVVVNYGILYVAGVSTEIFISRCCGVELPSVSSPSDFVIDGDLGWSTISESFRSRCGASVVGFVVLLSVLGRAETAHDFCEDCGEKDGSEIQSGEELQEQRTIYDAHVVLRLTCWW